MLTTLPQQTQSTTQLDMEAAKQLHAQRLAEADKKELLKKAILAVRRDGQIVYAHGWHILVAVWPHPVNQGDVVEVWLRREGVVDRRTFASKDIHHVTVWVRNAEDKEKNRIKSPFLPGKSWVRVFYAHDGKATDEDRLKWVYIPGAWEDTLYRMATAALEDIQRQHQEKQNAELERLVKQLFAPRPV